MFDTLVMMKNKDVSYLDEILFTNSLLNILPARTLKEIPISDLQLWGNKKGVYTFPTWELIDWLKGQIGHRLAIEICSGNGAIGRALGIPRTDSYIQTEPSMKMLYELLGQCPIEPPEDVERFEANRAVDFYRPEVVIGSYVTQIYQKGDEGNPGKDEPPKIGSSIYGVDELALYDKVQTYICIGNRKTHSDKRLLQKPHRELQFDFLFTRASSPEDNVIYIWDNIRP